MNRINTKIAQGWTKIGTRFLPFADAGTVEYPLSRLLRLALFQVSVGMAFALLNGTLNRVMIVELNVPTWLVAMMVALPLVFAPFRALIGFKSDNHRSVLGWKRVPYIWIGSMLQFGGFAIMPFALLVLSGDGFGPVIFGQIGAALAFLLVGAGMHTTQTAGIALATDLVPAHARPRAVALLYVMLMVGMVASSLAFGYLLKDFNQVRLIKVIQGAAVVTMALNIIALWKQEARDPSRTRMNQPNVSFRQSWQTFINAGQSRRLLIALGLGSAAFSMQDILLEPYGGQIMHMAVGDTTQLTAMTAAGALFACALAARWLSRGSDPLRLASGGLLTGLAAFASIIFAEPLESALLFRSGAALIGLGGGLFAIGTLTAAMNMDMRGQNGLALGAWGAVQASCSGLAIALGGALRDVVSGLAAQGTLGPALSSPAVGYSFVYHLEIALLFATLVAIGPLVRWNRATQSSTSASKFGLAEFPG